MKRAIHHVELNEKLQECFDLLDKITRTYRDYNAEYIEIVNGHPNTMEEFYKGFERECLFVYKLFGEEKREEIEVLFQKETEER